VKAGVTTLVRDELAYHIFIHATARDVWDALTMPGWTGKYGYRTRVKCDPQPGEPPTRLTWEIHEERTGLTAVTVRHECPGAPQTAALAADQAVGSGGWSWVLSDLKTLLETGRPLTT
jgi:uncharacterized protein YndB with AHSA1/START domain